MKKAFVTFIASLACAFSLAFPTTAFADSTVYSEGTLYYTVNNGSISIVGTFGNEQTVKVPASIGGYPVNTIKANAFDDNPNLLEVQLPDTITTIEQGALPSSVEVNYYVPSDNDGTNTNSGNASNPSYTSIEEPQEIDTSTTGSMLDTDSTDDSEDEASLDGVSSSNKANDLTSNLIWGGGACVVIAAAFGTIVLFLRRVR